MARIGIAVLGETGHINATLRLRAELHDLGHDVRYIAGLRRHPPSGHVPAELARYTSRHLPHVLSTSATHLELGDFRPDVLLVDAFMPRIAMTAWRQRIPVAKLSTGFSQRHDPIVPPLDTDLLPAADAAGRARLAAAWQSRADFRLTRYGLALRALAAELGFPLDWLDERSAISTTVRLPELALCPEELDFPRQDTEHLYYAGPGVDLTRAEHGAEAAGRLTGERPLIYCSFGSQTERYAALGDCLRRLADAARLLPHLQFVVTQSLAEDSAPPENVRVWPNAPQLALLRRARLMVTHGGLNGIREAMLLAVPVVVLPFDIDQPGNAARVQHHGYGRLLRWEGLTAPVLAETIAAVLEDNALRARVAALGQRLQIALAERQSARAFMECWAAARSVFGARTEATSTPRSV